VNSFWQPLTWLLTSRKAWQTPAAAASAELAPSRGGYKLLTFVIVIVTVSTLANHGASLLTSTNNSPSLVYGAVHYTNSVVTFISTYGYLTLCTLAFSTVVGLLFVKYISSRLGLTQWLDVTALRLNASAEPLAATDTTRQSLLSGFDRDLDFFSSTDFEDLLVFTLDVLELL